MARMKGLSLEQFVDRFDANERAEIDSNAKALIAEEMSLRELRKAMGKTQTQLARKLNKPQASVSRIEKQSDMLISTLDRIVHGIGGTRKDCRGTPGPAAVVPDRSG